MAWWIWALGSPPPDPTTRPESRLGPRGRVSAGEGQGGLWGDVLSTHCEEAGDVTRRRVDWPSA
jgi:hypothetical protein